MSIDLNLYPVGKHFRLRCGAEVVYEGTHRDKALLDKPNQFHLMRWLNQPRYSLHNSAGEFDESSDWDIVAALDRTSPLESRLSPIWKIPMSVDTTEVLQRTTTTDRDPNPAPQDPWQHRAQHMRCATCMWFAPKAGTIGRCRRHAPTMSGYPVVYVTDWCGDHKLNEEAAPAAQEAA